MNLITIPGRMCSNGKPAPIDQDDFKKFAQGLADAGKMTYDAAKAKDLDRDRRCRRRGITEACAACHEIYRERAESARGPLHARPRQACCEVGGHRSRAGEI